MYTEAANVNTSPDRPAPIAWVGIDPGVSNGVARYCPRQRQLQTVETFEFWPLIEHLHRLQTEHGDRLRVVIEDPRYNRPTFKKQKDETTGKREKISQDVGYNKALAAVLIDFLHRRSIYYQTVKPLGKKTAAEFRLLTKWRTTTNQHERDAGLLVFGR